ncbi:PhzF family phenazine biosynthesis protein [Aeromonas dhakensis]|uniref:PhzF family phenazine biosynthesis protein n=1 Tax=Aeromonas dhakensis TaxID=196024 RepID=UPI0024453588|nr:PhzF family phenazine biosynthesis protein [Aeromonas dhakensis]
MKSSSSIKIPFYQVDAFTSQPFGGNPAGVCPLETWLDDEVLQAIAIENNLSETAFFIPAEDGYHLRWFTPGGRSRFVWACDSGRGLGAF